MYEQNILDQQAFAREATIASAVANPYLESGKVLIAETGLFYDVVTTNSTGAIALTNGKFLKHIENLKINGNVLKGSITINASQVPQDANNRFITDTERTNWNNKSNKTVQMIAGNGLTGGGTLEANRTFNVVSANDGIVVNADNIQLNPVNALNSTSTTRPLTAAQGKALEDKKLNLSGGTMTGNLNIKNSDPTRLVLERNNTKTSNNNIKFKYSDAEYFLGYINGTLRHGEQVDLTSSARIYDDNYKPLVDAATKLQTAKQINGTNFDGTSNITTANWGTARTLTIGATGKSVNGSANVSWSLAEIGLGNVNNTADSAKNVLSATKLTTARTIGGVSFDGTANINLPGVNTTGNQNTTGNANSATILQNTRTINGTNFNGSANITTSNWGTARNIQIGNTTKSLNGSGNVSWSLSEIGAVNKSGDSMTGNLTVKTSSLSTSITNTYSNASIRMSGVNTGNTAGTYFLPLTSQFCQHGEGYLTHVTTGLVKNGYSSGWGEGVSGFFVGVGGSDSNPTEYFTLAYGGKIKHSRGHEFYSTDFKPSKADVGLGNVNNWGASSAIGANSTSEYATTNMVAQVRSEKANTNHTHSYVPLAAGPSITIHADSDSSSTSEFIELKAGHNALRVTSSAGGGTVTQANNKITYNGHAVYHAGQKPTPADVGAVNKAGDTMTGPLNANGGINMGAANITFNAADSGDIVFGAADGTVKSRVWSPNSGTGLQLSGNASNVIDVLVKDSTLRIKGNAIVDSQSFGTGVEQSPAISLAIGDNDTGFNWASDGNVEAWSNNVKLWNLKDVYHTGKKPTATDVGLGNVPNTVHTTAATANTVAVRDSSGDINVRLLRPNYADQSTISGAMAFRINNGSDNFIRFCNNVTNIRNWLGAAASSHNHDASNITAGTLAVARGGTGTTSSTGSGANVLNTSPTFSGTITHGGMIQFSNSGTAFRGLQGTMGDNDHWRIGGAATATNAGYLEIATCDDNSEPIYVRQYTGVFSTLNRTATLLDASGNTSFPGTVTGSKVYNAVWNDYAEYFPKLESTITEAGDIIALSFDDDGEFYELATEDHVMIVGAHSDQYGHLIGGENPPEEFKGDFTEWNDSKFIPVGLVGRLPVKFIGEAKKGMKVVPSHIPGVGRKFDSSKDDYDKVIGYIVENNNEEGIRRVKIKIGK